MLWLTGEDKRGEHKKVGLFFVTPHFPWIEDPFEHGIELMTEYFSLITVGRFFKTHYFVRKSAPTELVNVDKYDI